MIRELFVELGEATLEALKEAADQYAKAVYEPPAAPKFSLLDNLEGMISIMHDTLGDRTLRVERDVRDLVIVFSHRCKLCNKRHCVRVDEPMFLGAVDTKAYVDLIYSEIEGLLQRPCPNMEIGKKA